MRCNICGKDNPSNVDLCLSCGSALPRAASLGAKSSDSSWETDFSTYFRETCREFARSPLMILFAIWYSITAVLTFTQPSLVIRYAGGSLVSILYGVDVLSACVVVVGIWITCLDGWRKYDPPIRLAGLSIMIAVQMISAVFVCILVVLVLLTNPTLIVVALVGFIAYLAWLKVSACISIRNAIRDCEPDTRHIKALAIIQFVSAGLTALLLLVGASDSVLQSISSIVGALLAGAILLLYKNMMEHLEVASVQMNTEVPEKAKEPAQEYIPAWKRVQMEKENNEA